MRWIFPIFLLLFQLTNAQLNEKFDDGDFLFNPEWYGTTSKFIVDNNGRLQLNAPAEASEAWLFTSSVVSEDAVWEMDISMLFDPSSQNYCRINLIADGSELTLSKNGFYVMLGGTEDEVSLYQIKNGVSTKIIDGTNGRLTMTTVSLKLKVGYSFLDGWLLQINLNGVWITEGVSPVKVELPSKWFGIYCKYSSTRNDKFLFDNIKIEGKALRDREKPRVTSVEMLTSRKMVIQFSESINFSQLENSLFTIQPINKSPQQIIWSNSGLTASLQFNDPLPPYFNGAVQVGGTPDLAGNLSNDTTIYFNYTQVRCENVTVEGSVLRVKFSKPIENSTIKPSSFVIMPNNMVATELKNNGNGLIELKFGTPFANKQAYQLLFADVVDTNGDSCVEPYIWFNVFDAVRGDVIFSELMIDPEPANDLPATEYIEIHNRNNIDINLNGYAVQFGDKLYPITSGLLKGGGFACLVAEKDAPKWTEFENIITLKSFPSLTNSAGKLILYSPQKIALDAVIYNSDWLEGTFKDEGGWSYEIIDASNRSGVKNWAYTLNLKGGTPGQPNSVNQPNIDQLSPRLLFIEVNSSTQITLIFSEGMDWSTFIYEGFSDKQLEITDLQYDTLFCQTVTLTFNQPLLPGMIYEFSKKTQITDFAGNSLIDYFPLKFGLPQPADVGDLVINELLFNPTSQGSDFIEVKNRSNKILSLRDIYLSKIVNGVPEKLMAVSTSNIPLLNDAYWTFTPDVKFYQNHANSPCWLLQCSLPSMPDDSGDIAITNSTGLIIDRVTYSKKWHYQLLSSQDGVSLERISTEGASNDANNWHSASEASGFCTPTAINSQAKIETKLADAKLKINTEVFTPNGDGENDLLLMEWKNSKDGGSATLKIFDSMGRLVKTIANNELLGSYSIFKWDGTSEKELAMPPGIYVIWLKVFYKDGTIREERTHCVLSVGNNH